MWRHTAYLAAIVSAGLGSSGAMAQSVSFYDTMSGANFVQWWQTKGVPACQAESGADIRYTSAGSPEVLQRIKAAGSGQGDIDVLFLAPDKIAAFKNEGVLEDLRTYANLIPNLAKTGSPDKDQAAGTDLEGVGAPFFRYSYSLIYNSDPVKNPPKTWKELYERRNDWKGRISYVDPRSTVSGAGRFFAAMFLRSFGADLNVANGQESASWGPAWEKLAEFEKANATKHAESGGAHIAQFATGEIWMGFHALDFALYSKKIGTIPESIKTILPEDGVPGGAGYLSIPKNILEAKKQTAAKFINCVLSDPIQIAMVQEMFQFPGTDIWDKLPQEVYKTMPTQEAFRQSRAPDPPAAALKHISEVWAKKVGY
jgi:putative spermidine/putrescine transport system substrate-binding protein